MNKSNISWEIIVAGLAFTGIAFFLLADRSEPPHHPDAPNHAEAVPAPPLPTTIVIDLQNLESLKSLRNLESLKQLENLEIELENLDALMEHSAGDHQALEAEETARSSMEQSLRILEEKLKAFEEGDFNIKLQDKKVVINRQFEVDEGSWSEVSPGVYLYRKSIDPAQMENLNIDLEFGNVTVVGSEDNTQGEILLQATGDRQTPQLLDSRMQFTFDGGGDRSTFTMVGGQGHLSDRINMEATVRVPHNANLTIATSGGHITATHLDGEHRFETSGGHIRLDGLSGNTYAKTLGGHISSQSIDGTFTLATSGGNINLDRASGRIDLTTGGGHINIGRWIGEGTAKTSGGNISADLFDPSGPVELSASVGNISVLIPRSLNADITATGNQAAIDPLFDFTGDKSPTNITGSINGGGIPITLKCEYGNVSIKPHE